MGLFKKKCEYCKEKIDKGEEVFRHVKDPAFTGTIKKAFCSENHGDLYVSEVGNKKSCKSGCC